MKYECEGAPRGDRAMDHIAYGRPSVEEHVTGVVDGRRRV